MCIALQRYHRGALALVIAVFGCQSAVDHDGMITCQEVSQPSSEGSVSDTQLSDWILDIAMRAQANAIVADSTAIRSEHFIHALLEADFVRELLPPPPPTTSSNDVNIDYVQKLMVRGPSGEIPFTAEAQAMLGGLVQNSTSREHAVAELLQRVSEENPELIPKSISLQMVSQLIEDLGHLELC